MPRKPVMPGALATYSQGESFCARDFDEMTSVANAKNLLARYASAGLLERLLPGVYCLTPEGAEMFDANKRTHGEVGRDNVEVPEGPVDEMDPKTTIIYPFPEDVAHTVARLRRWIIVPAGEFALSSLGVIPAKTGELTFASTGSTLSYDYQGTEITFIHTGTRELVGLGETTRLVVQALRAARKVHAGEEVSPGAKGIPTVGKLVASIARTFSGDQICELEREAAQLPQWMQAEIRRIPRLREEARRAARAPRPDATVGYEMDPTLLDSPVEAFRAALSSPSRYFDGKGDLS